MTARKARQSDLAQALKPAVNGNQARPADGQSDRDVEPQPFEPRIASAFPPIADYAFLSDCEVNCLVAPSGRVEWMCLPRPDSPSVRCRSASSRISGWASKDPARTRHENFPLPAGERSVGPFLPAPGAQG